MAGPFTVGELAVALGGEVRGNADLLLTAVQPLATAGPSAISFLSNRKYRRVAESSEAGCLLVAPDVDVSGERTMIVCDDPYVGFAETMALFHPYTPPKPGVDPRAFVDPSACVEGARIEAFAWIGPGSKIGFGTWVESGAVVGAGSIVGNNCRLMPNSVVMDGCLLGDRVWLNPGAVIGGEGFGFAPGPQGHTKIPQAGGVQIGNDVEVGSNSCVDRGAMESTQVRDGAKLDNFVQVGHAADIGEHALMVAYSGVAGSTKLGKGVVLAAKTAVLGHLQIGDGVQVGVASVVSKDQPSGAKVTGVPAIEHRRWLRSATAFSDIPELLTRIREMEQRIADLEAKK
ncbi:MAG: UDP-3-O-(3-hydroxymyristoyl)glucosamine N-acyltransferase [Deltaproteobacteria bacterium]|nr:UDP-3-O-(3-hydroxymyristoyl)glucosamine N-acyltransferase [Deltaproteobacteria bacterium]